MRVAAGFAFIVCMGVIFVVLTSQIRHAQERAAEWICDMKTSDLSTVDVQVKGRRWQVTAMRSENGECVLEARP
ncbi:hypothetical protein HYV70_01670 [Candidatus Uhrbacteria bacterium]|nr:hypothetical protein [Candidatus Uhrbacteria bacterium]